MYSVHCSEYKSVIHEIDLIMIIRNKKVKVTTLIT